MAEKLQLAGKRFGKLIAVEPIRKEKRYWIWKCKCDCGNETESNGSKLLLGRKKSCGCLLKREGRWNWSGYKDISGFFWRRILENAKSRQIPVSVSIQESWNVFEKQRKKCVLTGEPLSFSTKNDEYDGNASLDRIDSSKGYIEGNIQWIHKDVNIMKWDMSVNDLIYWSQKISDHCKNIVVNLPDKNRISKRNKKSYYSPKPKLDRQKREKNYTLKNPDGKIIHINNMMKFCRQRHYDKGRMYSLANGGITNYRGWTKI